MLPSFSSFVTSLSVIAILPLLGNVVALPENIPGARLLPPGSHGERGGSAGGVSAAEQFAINDKLTCSGDMSTPYNATCWKTLDVASYILNWVQNTPKCDLGNNTCIRTGCRSEEAWSSCFLRLATGTPDYNCTQINVGHCTMESFPLKDVNSVDMPPMRYVARNIFAINNFFVNWCKSEKIHGWNKLPNPQKTDTGDPKTRRSNGIRNLPIRLSIPSIITTLDPEKKTSSTLEDILTALTAGLAFLSLPSISALVPATTSLLSTVLITSLQQAPPVALAIFKTPDSSSSSPSQTIQISQLASQLSTLNARVGEMLDRGLALIMHDPTAFTAFATPSGAFSGPEILSLPKETSRLDLALKTHLVAAAMAANDWTVFTGPPDNVETNEWFNSTLASNAERFVCNVAKAEEGICDTIDSRGVVPLCQPEDWSSYTSPYTHRAYYPSQGGGRNAPPSARLLHAIVDNGWGTLDAILDGGYNCSLSNGGAGVSLRFKEGGGGIEFGCLAGRVRMENGCREVREKGWREGCDFFFERHKKPPVVHPYGNVQCH